MAEQKIKIDATTFLINRPFGDDSEKLFAEWFDAARLFVRPPVSFSDTDEFRSAVNGCFASLENHYPNNDQHLFEKMLPLYASSRRVSRPGIPDATRPYLLLRQDFSDSLVYLQDSHSEFQGAQIDIQNEINDKVKLFSPLYFLRRLLTSPDFIASEAYSHSIIRAEIFASATRTFCNEDWSSVLDFISDHITYERISKSLSKISSYIQGRDTIYMDNASDFIVGNTLASMGLLQLCFSASGVSKKQRNELKLMPIGLFLQSKNLDFTKQFAYELRKLPEVDEFPSAAQLLSELDGITVAMPGLRTIFSGGVRSTKSSGAVIRISGKSGTGKTTLALSTCAALAPLGTITYYLSSEEEEVDLVDRIHSVTPPFILNTRTYKSPRVEDSESWFNAFHLSSGRPEENRSAVSQFIGGVLKKFGENGVDAKQQRPPGVAPFVVVLDGVHELIQRDSNPEESQISMLHEFVNQLRSLNALVVLLSAEIEEPVFRALDYLVDVVISLDGANELQGSTDSLRDFHLVKTRRQFSNTGKHNYHISKRGGVRLYPNIASTLARYKMHKWTEPNKNIWYDFLAYSDGQNKRHLLKIFGGSHVLITGKGSTGKAGFALRMLSSPLVNSKTHSTEDLFFSSVLDRPDSRRRILIISFLYPSSYYDDIVRKIQRTKRFPDRVTLKPTPDLFHTVLKFYPGNMSGEVLISRISEELRRGVVQGTPYDSVLIDGLHNVFLQFPALDKSTLVWPILSEIFRRAGVSVATTHAHFDVIGMDEDQHLAMDVRSMSNRSVPLLQSLVNSADFYLDVSTPDRRWGESAVIDVGTAFDQALPAPMLAWNRAKMCTETLDEAGILLSEAQGMK